MRVRFADTISLIIIALESTNALKIDSGPLGNFVQGQPVTITWTRDGDEADCNFLLGKVEISGPRPGISIFTTVSGSQTQGVATFSFVDAGSFLLGAVATPTKPGGKCHPSTTVEKKVLVVGTPTHPPTHTPGPAVPIAAVSVSVSASAAPAKGHNDTPTDGSSKTGAEVHSTTTNPSRNQSPTSRDTTLITTLPFELPSSQYLTSTPNTSAPSSSNASRSTSASPSGGSPASPQSKTGLIVGTTCGATFLIFLIIGGFLCYRMRSRTSHRRSASISPAVTKSQYPFALPDKENETHDQSVVPDTRPISFSPPPSTFATVSWIDGTSNNTRSYDFTARVAGAMEPGGGGGARPLFGALTARQMKIKERILELEVQMIDLNDRLRIERAERRTNLAPLRPEWPESERQMWEIREKIAKLKVVQESKWARGLSDVMPVELAS